MRDPGAELLAATVMIETSPVEVVATQGLVVAVPAVAEPSVALETVEIRQVGVAQGKAAATLGMLEARLVAVPAVARGEAVEHRVEVAVVPLAAVDRGKVGARAVFEAAALPPVEGLVVQGMGRRVEVAVVLLEAAAQGRVEATAAPGEPVPRAKVETRLAVALAA